MHYSKKFKSVLSAAAAAGIAGVAGTRAIAQTVPIQNDDTIFGLSLAASGTDGIQHLRGPATANGAVRQTTDYNKTFIQSIEFDNLNGFQHAYDGNLLGVDHGGATLAGEIYSFSTQSTTAPGPSQNLFFFTDYNASHATQLIPTRFDSVSVSPDNKHIAVGGETIDGSNTGIMNVFDYSAGATPGQGAGATITFGTQLSGVVTSGSNSNTVGVAWMDNSHFLTLANPANGGAATGTLKKITVGANDVLSSTDVATIPLAFGTAAFNSIIYEPTLSPYVYVGTGQRSGVTANTLQVLDPNNNFASVGSFDFSTANFQTARELAFDSKGNLYWSTFLGQINVIAGANVLANLSNNNYQQWYNSGIASSFNGIDTASAKLDYKTPGVTADIANKKVVVRYFPGTVNDPTEEIRARLKTGRNGGAWNGTGSAIISSTAAAATTPANQGIGYAQASELGLVGGQWGGVTVDGPAILMRETYYGDANLNGKVDGGDYGHIDTTFNKEQTAGSISGWFNGDFDYNGKVDGADYGLIDSVFNSQNGTLARALSFLDGSNPSTTDMTSPALQLVVAHFDDFGQLYSNAFFSTVPEPTSISAIALVGLTAGMRRRRRA